MFSRCRLSFPRWSGFVNREAVPAPNHFSLAPRVRWLAWHVQFSKVVTWPIASLTATRQKLVL